MLIYTTGCFIIGESASFTDLPTEMTEEERREQLRKPEKDRIKVSQEELDMVQYKKWWNKQVRGGLVRSERDWGERSRVGHGPVMEQTG